MLIMVAFSFETMFIDEAVIFVRGGKGGDGCMSFRREAYAPKGGPDGGDGGDGGSVYMVCKQGFDTLMDMTGRHHWRAENGMQGGGKSCSGKKGEDLEIRVPLGTMVFDDETGALIADLDEVDKKVLIAKGGRGGKGNEHFKRATHQTPREWTPGGEGEELTLRLELKLIADVGLVGLPNAGKSTTLAKVTKATPKVADYPFTTLEPQLGIMELPHHHRLIIADIPGLIEGAAEGTGLGHTFLRHIERTKVLVHVIDPDPVDESDPLENYHVIRKELERYSDVLAGKTEIVAINKMDLLFSDEDREAAVQLFEEELGRKVYAISAVSGYGMEELFEYCWKITRDGDDE